MNANGDFDAWGIGFYYEYNCVSKQLTIIHARRYRPLIDIEIEPWLAKEPELFVHALEKTTQIQALLLSNNKSVDITEIFSQDKLLPYLENALRIATDTAALEQKKFSRFQKKFCATFNLRTLRIEQIHNFYTPQVFYRATLKTNKNNQISSQAFYLHNTLGGLSRKIISDLIIKETANNMQPAAHLLLSASSKLSTLSLILNPSLIPHRKITRKLPENPQGSGHSAP